MSAVLGPIRAWLRLSTWKQVLIALILGAVTGLLMGHHADLFKPVGDLFINAIHMMVVPVVFTAIVCAILSVDDAKKMRRVTIKALFFYLICMALAATIGISVATLIAPGVGFHPLAVISNHAHSVGHLPSFSKMIEGIIPSNPVAAFSHENVLQIVMFALILGISIKMVGKSAEPVVDFFQAFLRVVFKLAEIIIRFAPYGIFALIAWTFGHFGWQAVMPLFKFVLAVYLGCAIQLLLVYSLGLWALGRLKPTTFFKGILAAMTFSYTTSSSAATLPLSMQCAEKNLGVPKSMAQFLLPLGASFNLNGLSIYLSVATVFAANMYGIHLGAAQYLIIIATIVFSAMGAAAIPGSALIVMGAVMSSVGIPLGALALIAGVDRLNDMAQTSTNVAGDIFVLTLVAKREKVLKKSAWEQLSPEVTPGNVPEQEII